jgi:hypothetical protein
MLKKLRGALVVGATVAASFGAAGVAAANDADVQSVEPAGSGYVDDNDSLIYRLLGNVNLGNDLCGGNWQWAGGIVNGGTVGYTSDSEVCEDYVADDYPAGINVLNNACVLNWSGSAFSVLTADETVITRVCNQRG